MASHAKRDVSERQRLTHWPLRAKVTVAVLALILVIVVGAGSARHEAVKDRVSTGLPPSSAASALPPSSSTAVATVPGTASPPPTASPTPSSTAPATVVAPAPVPSNGGAGALLAQLRIVDGAASPPGYSRDLFPTWLDLDGNGCDARDDTLIAESLVPAQVTYSDGCDVVSGRWLSIYDGLEVTEPSDLDVDHLVPLAEAWRSGAHAWEAVRRAAFANDLTFPDHLIAVTASTNRSKSDSPPNEWRPPQQETWCRYANAWVTVKMNWSLTITTAERDALGQMLDTC